MSGSKLHQHAAGIPLFLYWMGELAWDLFVFLISGGLCFPLLWWLASSMISRYTWGWFLLAFFLFAASSAGGTYFLSFLFQSGTTIQAVMIAGGVVVPILVGALHAVGPQATAQPLTYVFLLVPHSAFAQIFYTLVFECTCGAKFNECPQGFLSAKMALIPFVYLTVEAFVYFLAVVSVDGLKHDPHMALVVGKFRCFNPEVIRRRWKKVARAETEEAVKKAQREALSCSVCRGRKRKRPDAASSNTNSKYTSFESSSSSAETGFWNARRDLIPFPILKPFKTSADQRSFRKDGPLTRRGSLGVRNERRLVLKVVEELRQTDKTSSRHATEGLLTVPSRRVELPTAARTRKPLPKSVRLPVTEMLVADGLSKWKVDHLDQNFYLPKIRCWRKRRTVINDRSYFTVRAQQTLGLFGLNGCGMSSMLNLLSGKEFPTEGKLWIDGRDLSKYPYERWGRVGYCGQTDETLENRMTGREILEMFGRISMIERSFLRRTVIPEALLMVGLRDVKNCPVEIYSEGDKRKLSFLLSLMNGPKILLLDSPTLGMDSQSRKRIWSVIMNLKKDFRKAVVVATPRPEECEALCDKVACLQEGRIISIGPLDQVKKRFGRAYEVVLNLCAYETFESASLDQLSARRMRAGGDLTSRSTPGRATRHLSPLLPYSSSKSAKRTGAHHTPDRAEFVVDFLLEELESVWPGSEVVELLETHVRIVIPLKGRRLMSLTYDDDAEDDEDDDEDDDDKPENGDEKQAADQQDKRKQRRWTADQPRVAPPVMPSASSITTTTTTTSQEAAGSTKDGPGAAPIAMEITDDRGVTRAVRLDVGEESSGSSTDESCGLPVLEIQDSLTVKDYRRGKSSRSMTEPRSSMLGSFQPTISEHSDEGGGYQAETLTWDGGSHDDESRRGVRPTLRSVFKWFEQRRSRYSILELRVQPATLETFVLLHDLRRQELCSSHS